MSFAVRNGVEVRAHLCGTLLPRSTTASGCGLSTATSPAGPGRTAQQAAAGAHAGPTAGAGSRARAGIQSPSSECCHVSMFLVQTSRDGDVSRRSRVTRSTLPRGKTLCMRPSVWEDTRLYQLSLRAELSRSDSRSLSLLYQDLFQAQGMFP
jgi:hypothetical protein